MYLLFQLDKIHNWVIFIKKTIIVNLSDSYVFFFFVAVSV